MAVDLHKLTVRVKDQCPGDDHPGAFGGHCEVLLDDKPICWQSLTIGMSHDDFHHVVLRVAVGELDIDAEAIVNLQAQMTQKA